MLSAAELAQVAAAAGGEGVRLVVHAGSDAELGVALANTARQLSGAVNGVGADHGDGRGLAATPALAVVSATRDNVVWSAAPEGPEASPFAEHVAALLCGAPSPAWTEPLTQVGEPAELLVFIAATCPHCPNAVRVATAAARASAAVRVLVVDVQRHEQLAARYSVTSVPATVIDGGLTLTGVPEPAELVAAIRERGGAGHGDRLFLSLIENGRLDEAVESVRAGCAPFVAAWQRSSTSSRMALMLVAERLLAVDRGALDDAVLELVGSVAADDAALRGDTADLLGQIGDPRARAALESLLTDANPDVVEIAGDALAMLRPSDVTVT